MNSLSASLNRLLSSLSIWCFRDFSHCSCWIFNTAGVIFFTVLLINAESWSCARASTSSIMRRISLSSEAFTSRRNCESETLLANFVISFFKASSPGPERKSIFRAPPTRFLSSVLGRVCCARWKSPTKKACMRLSRLSESRDRVGSRSCRTETSRSFKAPKCTWRLGSSSNLASRTWLR